MGFLQMTPRLEPFQTAWKVNKTLIVIFMAELSANFSEYILYNPEDCPKL